MPIYEYTCAKCGHKFDKLVKSMTSTDPIACPQCGSKQTERELSVFAVNSESSSRSEPTPACQRCGQFGSCPMAE